MELIENLTLAYLHSPHMNIFDAREKRKMICKTLRFIAHMHGASLIFTSQKDDVSTSRVKKGRGSSCWQNMIAFIFNLNFLY